MKVRSKTLYFLSPRTALILSLASACFCETTVTPKDEIKTVSSSPVTQSTPFLYSTLKPAKPLASTVVQTTSTTKESIKPTKAYEASESPTTARHSTTKVYTSTKGITHSARRQKLNSSSSALGSASASASANTALSPARFQERLGAIDCDLPVLPTKSRLWRGNETHELNLPVTVSLLNFYHITAENQCMYDMLDFHTNLAANFRTRAKG